LPGIGGSSGLTFTSSSAGPGSLSAACTASFSSPGSVTLMPSAPLAVANEA